MKIGYVISSSNNSSSVLSGERILSAFYNKLNYYVHCKNVSIPQSQIDKIFNQNPNSNLWEPTSHTNLAQKWGVSHNREIKNFYLCAEKENRKDLDPRNGLARNREQKILKAIE